MVWSGNAGHVDNRNRSMPFETKLGMLPPDMTVLSPQKDPRPDNARAPKRTSNVIDLGPALGGFADTAAIVACLDLVISVDTSTAHPASAPGCPVWILLPFALTGAGAVTARTRHGIAPPACSARPRPGTGPAWRTTSAQR